MSDDVERLNALTEAAAEGKTLDVIKLLEDGISINGRDGNSQSALYRACCQGKSQTVRELLKRGADCNMPCNDQTPLYIGNGTHLLIIIYDSYSKMTNKCEPVCSCESGASGNCGTFVETGRRGRRFWARRGDFAPPGCATQKLRNARYSSQIWSQSTLHCTLRSL